MEKTTAELDKVLTREFLVKELVTKERKPQELAKEIGCCYPTILNRVNKYNLIIPNKWSKILTHSFLWEYYILKRLTCGQIAKLVGCGHSLVNKHLRKFNIPLRNPGWLKNRKQSEKTCLKKSKSMKGKNSNPQSEVHKLNRSKAMRGKKLIFSNPEERSKNLSKALKGKNTSEKHTKNVLKATFAFPNKFEIKCLDYLDKIYPKEFEYVGDGKKLIGGRSIDGYSEKLKVVILCNGTYYHCSPKKYSFNHYNKQFKKTAQEIWDKDKAAIEIFKKAGYKVIVIWEDEIDRLIENNLDPLVECAV